ncbi:MAG: hypothetical protein ABI882_03895 [Acidobacteriota bacterium]
MKLARLNPIGIDLFSEFLCSIHRGHNGTVPSSLLSDPARTEPLGIDLILQPRHFETRFAAAEFLNQAFSKAGLPDVSNDRGLWAWLSLFYFDDVCPPRGNGSRKPGELARHIPNEDYKRYYRHLLAGPYRIYRAHRDQPERALALLCQRLDSPGDVVEQLAAQQKLVTNPSVLRLATKLYVDEKTKRIKKGAGGKGSGSARRLTDVLEQFDVTWDLYAATTTELAKMLPREFEKFQR